MFEQVQYVDEIDLESIPHGSTRRFAVTIAHNGMGAAIALPVLVMRGRRPGPVFGITAAVHGNELNGIPVIHRLFSKIDPDNLRGTIMAVCVVNVPGFLNEQRTYGDKDLNHLMPGSPRGSTQRVYVHRFINKLVKKFDYLVDLHTASFGRINSLYVRADMTNEMTAQMAYLQRPQIIVHNPPSDRTLRGSAQAMGIPAITVEIGNPQRFQFDFIKRSLVGLRAVLAETKMLAKRPVKLGPQPILCERSYWMYTDAGGLLDVFPDVTERFEKDQVIARLMNIYGDIIKEYKAPQAGVVVGKSVNPVSPTGARILHLGLLADLSEFRFFARKETAPKKRAAGAEANEGPAQKSTGGKSSEAKKSAEKKSDKEKGEAKKAETKKAPVKKAAKKPRGKKP